MTEILASSDILDNVKGRVVVMTGKLFNLYLISVTNT